MSKQNPKTMRSITIAALCCLLCSCFYIPPTQENDNLYGHWTALIFPNSSIDITPSTMTFLQNNETVAVITTPHNIVGDEITLPGNFVRDTALTGTFTHMREGKLEFNTMVPNGDTAAARYIPLVPFTITFIR